MVSNHQSRQRWKLPPHSGLSGSQSTPTHTHTHLFADTQAGLLPGNVSFTPFWISSHLGGFGSHGWETWPNPMFLFKSQVCSLNPLFHCHLNMLYPFFPFYSLPGLPPLSSPLGVLSVALSVAEILVGRAQKSRKLVLPLKGQAQMEAKTYSAHPADGAPQTWCSPLNHALCSHLVSIRVDTGR